MKITNQILWKLVLNIAYKNQTCPIFEVHKKWLSDQTVLFLLEPWQFISDSVTKIKRLCRSQSKAKLGHSSSDMDFVFVVTLPIPLQSTTLHFPPLCNYPHRVIFTNVYIFQNISIYSSCLSDACKVLPFILPTCAVWFIKWHCF